MSGPHPDPLALEAHLEPSAVAELGTRSETVLQASIAVSLKRIADALTLPCNQYGEPLAEAVQGAIARGLQGLQP